MPEAGGGARLSELEARWRTDRSPRVFLQLADELRRAGANERAVRVLQEGLTHHPDSVSGRVALGRLQLEQGDAPSAAETLERALARDPAQMVASKLLIETWIRMGDATRARERLDLYRILQERDGEIDDFERRIAAMERAERQAALEAARASSGEPAGAADGGAQVPSATPSSSPLFDFGGPRPLPPLDLMTSLGSPPTAVTEPARPSHVTAPHEIDARMPFGVIHDPVPSAARIRQFLRGEALFVPPGAVSALQPPFAEPAAESAREEPVSAFALATATAVEESQAIDLDTAQRAIEEGLERRAEAGEAEAAPEGPIAFEQFSTLHFAEEVERETLVEPLAEVLAEAGVGPDSSALAAQELEPAAVVPEAPGAAADEVAPVAPVTSGLPSATLARLYLDQGHLAEAEAEFRRVVAERPDDPIALAGLRDVGRRRAADETVSGWSAAGPLSSPRPLRALGLTQRKIETLRDYLERIRRGRPRAHVS